MTPKQIAEIVCTRETIHTYDHGTGTAQRYQIEFNNYGDQDAFWQLCKEVGCEVVTIDQHGGYYVSWSES